jgi:hypothetical protein
MRDYRAYILGIDGHRFVWVEDFRTDHADDAAALSAARGLSDKHDVEVWDGGRLVARLSSGEAGVSPGLVPSLPSFDSPVGPISLSKVSELASTASSESNPFVPSVESNPFVPSVDGENAQISSPPEAQQAPVKGDG